MRQAVAKFLHVRYVFVALSVQSHQTHNMCTMLDQRRSLLYCL